MCFTLFGGQCHFSGDRVEDFQTTAFQWIDSASLKAISAGETISTPVPGRRTLMSGCWCHVSVWMNISCAASPSTSAPPVRSASLLCLLVLPCPLQLSFLYSFLSPAPGRAVASNAHLLGWWLLMNARVHSAETPSPGALLSVDVCGSSSFCWSCSGSLWICTIWHTWPLSAQWLQELIYHWISEMRRSGAVNTLLYHTQSRSDLSFLRELCKRGRYHRGMEVQLLEEMKNAFYFWGLNFRCTLCPLFSSWLQKSES